MLYISAVLRAVFRVLRTVFRVLRTALRALRTVLSAVRAVLFRVFLAAIAFLQFCFDVAIYRSAAHFHRITFFFRLAISHGKSNTFLLRGRAKNAAPQGDRHVEPSPARTGAGPITAPDDERKAKKKRAPQRKRGSGRGSKEFANRR